MEATVQHIYFLGIGGIGMSALARYCRQEGYTVSGYDRTASDLTRQLEKEGIDIVYDSTMDQGWHTDQLQVSDTLVVRTPAVPEDQPIYAWLRKEGFQIIKRAELLGVVTRQKQALCVAGTHGKTTTSTLLAHIMHGSHMGGNAFLGGISNNYNSNLLLDAASDYVVVEADEFDRSFHHLHPYMTVITSIEPDHLDIYGTAEGYQEGFDQYAALVDRVILLKEGFQLNGNHKATIYTYTGISGTSTQADFYADQVAIEDGEIYFDLCISSRVVAGGKRISRVRLGVPVWVNIENSVAAMAIAYLNGVSEEELRTGVETFAGVWRRFNIHVRTPQITYVDDYAHHPTELQASMQSVRKVYANREQWVVFQPHLYSRTRDFMTEFAEVLSSADKLILLPIYPARELPMPGITSDELATIVRRINPNTQVEVVEKNNLCEHMANALSNSQSPVVVMTLGAGDIDRLVQPLTQTINQL